jgi:lysozyme family protein
MAVLEIALAYVLINEGSAPTNDPDDHGGLTRYGVTQATLSTYYGRAASDAEVLALTPATVAEVYQKLYWAPIQGDKIQSQPVATVLLDLAILCGPAAAVRMAQAILGVAADGLLGPKSLAALNAAVGATFVKRLSRSACQYFANIAVRNPTQAKWLPGWQIRAHKMIDQIVA